MVEYRGWEEVLFISGKPKLWVFEQQNLKHRRMTTIFLDRKCKCFVYVIAFIHCWALD